MITVVESAPYVAGLLGAGGVGAWASRRRELIKRWVTWCVTAPVVGGLLWLGAPGAAVLAAAIGVVCVAEYTKMALLGPTDRAALAAAVVGLALAAWLVPGWLPRVAVAAGLVVALVPVLDDDVHDGFRRLALGVLGLAWLGSLVGLVLLGPAALPLFIAVSVGDVAAFCGGRLLRGPLLSPLSPAKRVSGVLCGAAAGAACLMVFGAARPGLAVAVVLGAPLGDLVESMIKRGAGVKDAGRWLPGFGGLLDRVDSLLMALAIAAVLS